MTHYRYARRSEILGKSIYDHEPDTIVLSSGLAYPPLLPNVVREAGGAAGNYVAETLQYGPLMGIPDLRVAIRGFVAEDGVSCTIDNVLVTNGAKHALDLALRTFVEPGDRVIVAAPSYLTAIQIMRTHNVNFLAVPMDDEGLNTDELENRLKRLQANGERAPKLLFDIPDFHNPTGITMSRRRREALVALAERWNFVILEDDPYRRVRFDGEPVPSLKSIDEAGVVIALGTVSKILAPGLRVGWAIGEPEVVNRMAMQKAEGGSCPLTQRIVVDLMRSNKMALHIDELVLEMRDHRDAMMAAFARCLPEVKVRRPDGGYFLWAELPEGTDAEAVAELALEQGVEVSSGRLCFAEDAPKNFLRLAYSFVSSAEITTGVERLAEACRAHDRAA